MSRLRLRATPVGDALLVHPKGHLDERAAGFAGGLGRDPQHTLVVVDLPAGVLADEWRTVARLLSSSRYGSLRMVFGRDRGEDVRRAAALIAERLGREVLAADGALVPTVAGGLFVPGDDAAWIRFRPGRPAEPDSRRFPRPHWEFSLPTRARAVSARTTAEPVPSGVWLRHTDRNRLAGDHRRAVETVPTDPQRLLVVLGSPGMPPLPVDDVARYWDSVLPNARSAVRFYLYGTLDTPESLAPGQCLADVLDHEVVLYADLPSGAPAGAGGDGTLAYVPARSAVVLEAARRPGEAAAPNAVTPAAAETPGTGTAATPREPDAQGAGPHPDAGVPQGARAADSELGTGGTPAGVAGGSEIAAGDVPPIRSAGPAVPAGVRSLSQQALPRVQMVSGSTTQPPGAVREVSAPRVPGSTPEPTHTLPGAAQEPAVGRDLLTGTDELTGTAATPAPITVLDPGAAPEPDTAPDARALPDPAHAGPAPDLAPPLDPALDPALDPDPAPEPVPATGETSAPAPDSEPEPAPAPRLVRPAAPRFRLESGTPAPEPDTIPEPAAVPDAPPAPAPAPTSAPSAEAAGVRVQPVPKSAACALPPERGIARERDWLRRMFNEQYNATAGAVSRVMSETPGLRGGSKAEAADALTELVAVRLYLSGDSRGADAAVRAATAGPHVPLARCVTAGLGRLPSYRGPTLLRTRLTDADRAWYREGRLVTEWAFCHARTSLHTGPRGIGATDVLIWSMTSRRTTSLDPTFPDRVLFLPGTVFKVLRTTGNTVLMREVSPSEITEDGRVDVQQVRFDEIALKGLGNILDALEKADTDAEAESADPPGLIVTPDTGRTGRTEGANP
ncbi:hypothetical protein OG585_49610 (plasmid) [Streptomyces sp. NBC_01340]|uniref:hypothetical protein n=1 Tax=unclassified Streptomyces TaxID=2593676 RepID=UPI00225B01B0|nr:MULTISPECIES: hypothetical protein [unclassified Streptomyces]MCX4460792.1 hypothetical protein [Streptomyces sp. NBC_01719]MCX4499878.1 hypothetical protein [Streptomyces sp. NBC_01728]WSI45007.1 hypothetical protein OG585_49610 [Streptomyces sp. NBC_01340]